MKNCFEYTNFHSSKLKYNQVTISISSLWVLLRLKTRSTDKIRSDTFSATISRIA